MDDIEGHQVQIIRCNSIILVVMRSVWLLTIYSYLGILVGKYQTSYTLAIMDWVTNCET